MTPQESGSTELGSLAHALAATLRRRSARGMRRIAAVAPPERTAPAPTARQGRAQGQEPAQAAQPQPRPEAPAQSRPPQQEQPARPMSERPASERPAPERAAPERAASKRPPAAAAQAAPAEAPATSLRGPAPSEVAPTCSTLAELEAAVQRCTACELCETRSQTVFGDGSGRSKIVFVGEAPGADEDRVGRPFVGASGELLDAIITKGMGIARDDVYIANVLKCRPPGNRDPLPSEKALCTAWLDRQLELLAPRVLIPLGRHAATHLLGVDAPLGRLRAKVHDRQGHKVVPTYHPSYLLRSPHEKKKTWEDIQLAMHEAGIAPPKRS